MLWFRNGVGLWYSPEAGFGLPNVKMMYNLIIEKEYKGVDQARVQIFTVGK